MTRSPSLNNFSLFPGPNYYIGFICFVSVLLSQTHSQALSLSAIHPSDTVSHIRKHHFHFFSWIPTFWKPRFSYSCLFYLLSESPIS